MSTPKTITILGADLRVWITAILSFALTACAAPPTPLTPSLPQPPQRVPQAVVMPPAPALPHKMSLPAIQYTIQVGVFSSAERAQAYMEHLIDKGLDAYYFIDLDGYYKVRFERFDTRESANNRAATLQVLGVIESFFIVRPQQPFQPMVDERVELQGRLVETALTFIGVPYRWGGTSKQNGFDCSGLVMTVYRLHGMELPRSSADQFLVGDPVAIETLEKGDLVFFSIGKSKRIDHVGIYRGDGKFIHAPGKGRRISEAALYDMYFKTRYKGARRYF
jgi:hypothetical protein